MPPLELLGRRGGNETKHTTKSRFTHSLPVLNPQYTCACLFLNLKVCFQLVDLFHELPDDVSPRALAFFNVAQSTFFFIWASFPAFEILHISSFQFEVGGHVDANSSRLSEQRDSRAPCPRAFVPFVKVIAGHGTGLLHFCR